MSTIQQRFGLIFRRTIICTCLILLTCFMSMRSYGQATVYINPNYTGGSNDGSQAHPFTSWSSITSFNNNTSYLQMRGTTCNISSEIAIDEKTGVTFGVYGTGTDYAHIVTSINTGAVFKLEASLNCTVDGFHVKALNDVGGAAAYTNGANNYGIYVVDKEGENATVIPNGGNITIKNCLVEHFVWGIRIMEIGWSNLDNITVDNCIIRDIFQDGMFIQSWQGGDGIGGLHGLLIDHCHISDVNESYNYQLSQGQTPTETVSGGDGIQLSQYIQNYVIRNTVIDRRGTGLKFCLIHGDEQHTNKYGGTIQNCTFYTPDAAGGWGHYFAFLSTVNYRNNRVFLSPVAGAMLTRSGSAVNASFNTFFGSQSASQITFDFGSGPIKLHNNVIYGSPKVTDFTSGFTTLEAYNNIFMNTGSEWDYLTGVTKDFNLHYNAGYWTTTATPENNSIFNQDPKFVNPSVGDFRLQSTSPAINKGTNLGYTSDMVGTSLPQGAGYDMGAIEYISGSGDTQAPTTPTGLNLKNVTTTDFTFSWNPSTDNVGVVGYDVYLNGTMHDFSVTGTTAKITGLTQGATYSVTVKARDAAGNTSSESSPLPVTMQSTDAIAPSVPNGLVASNVNRNTFTLSWNPSTDNVGVFAYEVYKDSALTATVGAPPANIAGLSPSTTYKMTVKAKDVAGNASAMSSVLSVTTLAACGGPEPFTNTSFTNQTGTFTAQFDVVPGGSLMDGVAGLSDSVASAYSALACAIQFYTDGQIRARNGNTYTSATTVNYNGGTSYHFRMVVNIGTHTYDIYVTPAGGSEVTLGTGYAFRNEQASVTKLNNYAKQTNSCTLTISNFSLGTPVPTNIALFKPISASSIEKAALGAAYANDGNASATRWSSAFSDPQWICINLGAVYNISSVVLRWQTAYGKAYKIEVSNDSLTWTSVYSTATGDGGVDYISLSASAKYIRMWGTTRGTIYGYSLWEFEVYGVPSGARVMQTTPASLTVTEPIFKLYPNPAKDHVELSLSSSSLVRITDMNGRVVLKRQLAQGRQQLNFHLTPGLYLVQVTDENRKITTVKMNVQ